MLLALIVLIIWWFNRKFDVTIKYNNGTENEVVKIKYLKHVDKDSVKDDITLEGYSFVGYFETYNLSSKQIEAIKNDSKKEDSICKKRFKLNEEKTKCIAKEEFDFTNTKIKKDTTIEAIWSTITFTINPTDKTINEGESFTITATITGTSDTTVKWSYEEEGIASVDKNGTVTGVIKDILIL